MSIPFPHKCTGRPGAFKPGFADQCPVCGARPACLAHTPLRTTYADIARATAASLEALTGYAQALETLISPE